MDTHIDFTRQQKSSRFPLIKFYGKKKEKEEKGCRKGCKV